MRKQGFASMYMVYSFFLVFIIMMLSVMMINNYKKTFLNALKNDIKDELSNYYIAVKVVTDDVESQEIVE